ncbi:hypothetical protein BGZ63DRAFT_390708 [Mariannaea sp. PMI_226]|nr:hypothetical protein BGZ63DRAFT_390708 [Mariannaea sp. PMI_226]
MPSTEVERTKGFRHDNRLWRAFVALPILVLSMIMVNAFSFAEPFGYAIERVLDNSLFEWNGLEVPIIRNFYGLQFIDAVFAPITVAFAQLQFFGDERAYWQSLVFLAEFAGIYAILFFESLRPVHSGTLFAYPFLLAFFAQLGGVGILGPLYFYFFYVFSSVKNLTSDNFVLRNGASCVAVLPTVLLAYHLPLFPSYFHPSLEARNWWNWVWQLYPVWGSILLFVLSNVFGLLFKQTPNNTSHQVQLSTIRVTVGTLALINSAVWWYSLSQSTYSWSAIFVPQNLFQKPEAIDLAMRLVLQYDYICSFAAVVLWLALQFRDLGAQGVYDLRYAQSIAITALIGVVFGPGTLLLFIWLVREEILVARLYSGKMKKP